MLPKSADYASLSESYIIFVCDFDYSHIGKAVGERISLLKDTTIPQESPPYDADRPAHVGHPL